MKHLAIIASIALSASLLNGCAAISNLSENMSYKTGTFVSNEQLSSIRSGMKQEQVVASLGYPADKMNVSGKEVWRYPYSKINGIPFSGKNESFTTVVEFNAKGLVLNAYKASGHHGSAGNPLLDAANGK